MSNTTYQQLIERAALTALDLHKATARKKSLKAELHAMYETFFKAHGRPEGHFHEDNEEFLPVMLFTDNQFQRVKAAKQAEYNAKRRHETAIRALAAHSKEAA